MKKLFYVLSIGIFFLTGCQNKISEMVTYKINEPIFMSPESFRSSVKITAEPQKISSIGKMCFYNNYLFISEPEKGIHIIDNRTPSDPKIVGFIGLMGNADIAIRNGMLYADSYIDLVWFDISNPALPELKGRLDSIFTSALPATDNQYAIDYAKCYGQNSKGIVVGWKLTERTEEVTNYTGGWWGGWTKDGDIMLNEGTNSTAGNNTGINGSMSRFTIYNNRLYSVINNNMNIFNLSTSTPTKETENIYVGWNVETIFNYKDNMFMGTPTGLIIYSVKNPTKPEYVSSIQHVFGCDPVVVDNDLAYVTVHSEANRCGQTANELTILNISDVYNPKQVVTYDMTSPRGLGIDNGNLFLCDDGLKVFKITDPQKLMDNKIAEFKDMNGFDVIANNNVVMMIADDGIYQYDYTDTNAITFLSKIPIQK